MLRRALFSLTVACACLLAPRPSDAADILGRSYTCSAVETFRVTRVGKNSVETQGLSLAFDGNGNFTFVDRARNTYRGTTEPKGKKRFKATPDQASLGAYQNYLVGLALTEFPIDAVSVSRFKWKIKGKVANDGTLTVRSKAIAKGRATALGKTRRGAAKIDVKLTGTEN